MDVIYKKAKKIFIGNYKGGVGKTTFTYNMGCILGARNNKVLLIDLDPQSSLTEVCFNDDNMNKKLQDLKDEETLNFVIDYYHNFNKYNTTYSIKIDVKNLILSNTFIDFIPSSYLYKDGGIDIQCLKMDRDVNDILIIKQFLEDQNIEKQYDYILFDCPPSNNIITLSAYYISDYYIIPTIMDAISTQGIDHYNQVIQNFYNNYLKPNTTIASLALNNIPKLLGVFEYNIKNKNTTKYRNLVKNKYKLFNTVIKDYAEIAKMIAIGNPTKENLVHFESLIDEIDLRIKDMES